MFMSRGRCVNCEHFVLGTVSVFCLFLSFGSFFFSVSCLVCVCRLFVSWYTSVPSVCVKL